MTSPHPGEPLHFQSSHQANVNPFPLPKSPRPGTRQRGSAPLPEHTHPSGAVPLSCVCPGSPSQGCDLSFPGLFPPPGSGVLPNLSSCPLPAFASFLLFPSWTHTQSVGRDDQRSARGGPSFLGVALCVLPVQWRGDRTAADELSAPAQEALLPYRASIRHDPDPRCSD